MTTHCVVPRKLAPRLLEPLRSHFAADPDVAVVVEHRSGERRASADRREADVPEAIPASGERRLIRNSDGRRVADRRAPVMAIAVPEGLPRRVRRQAGQLSFVECLEPPAEQREDEDTARRVIACQAGDREAFSVIYRRYFDRVYGYLRLSLRDTHEAEDMAQQTFLRALTALPRYERRRQPFRAWLFVIARNLAATTLAERRRVQPVDVSDLAEALLSASEAGGEGEDPGLAIAPAWLSDGDLAIFIKRLPESQRHALFLRFALDLATEEVAAVMGRTPHAVRQLHSRGLTTLRNLLITSGRESGERYCDAARVRPRRVSVLGARRFALGGGSLSLASGRPAGWER